MTRRRLIALVSIAVLFTLGVLIVGGITFLTRTSYGRDKVRNVAQRFIDARVHGGKIYIGRITGGFLTGITFDSVAIVDTHGELLVSAGRTTVSYDPRDLLDNRLYVRSAQIEHPYVHLIQHENGVWNFKEIFASPTPTVPKPLEQSTRGWGDYIVIDSAVVRNASFELTMPWHPDEDLRGAARDSAIRAHVGNPAKAVIKTPDGYGRRYVWKNVHGLISHARLADPDSDRAFGQQFHIDTLSADEFEPTFKFRNVTGDVRRLSDSLWLKIAHFEMPGSGGNGSGKVWWGSSLPVRYDIAIHGDSVSLADVNWVYPDLPTTGGGTLDLAIQNDPKDLQIIDFKLSKMDVRSTKSHLTGRMSFGIGAPVLLVRNVDLDAEPVDFDLLRTLAGKPFPVDWQGQLIGTVTGRGGPLTHFVIDNAHAVFRDAHVPGAESRFSGKGELDILRPAYTEFQSFDVDVASLDLRSIEYLYPSFPRLGGTIAGRATLDSSYLDVRFSNADVTHRDGPGEPSRFTGSGRVTYGEQFMSYDVSLEAQPLSLTMLARSPAYEGLPIHGLFSGPIRATGSSPNLEISTSLQSASGAFSFDGRVDIDTIGGMGARGHGQFSAVNLTSLLEKPTIPANTLNGHYEVDVESIGDNLATLHGSGSLALDRSVFDGLRVNPSHAYVRFADGQLKVDSLEVRSPAFTLTSRGGGLGLPNGRPDSLRFNLSVDSLGGLRFLGRADSAGSRGVATVDSITGTLTFRDALATGRLDSLSVRDTAVATDVYFNGLRAGAATLAFDLHNLPKALAGRVDLHVDTAIVASVVLDSITGGITFNDLSHAGFTVGAASHNGPSASAAGTWSGAGGSNIIDLSALEVGIDSSRWSLAAPARVAVDSAAIILDSLRLRNADSAVIAVSGRVPNVGPASGELRALHVPLRDVGVLAQFREPVTGLGDLSVSISGTKAAPLISGNLALSSLNWSGLDVSSAAARAQFRDQRLNVDGDVVIKGQTALTGSASLPVELSLFSAAWGHDTIGGFIKADSADLAVLQPLFPAGAVKDIKGRIAAQVNVRGTPQAKTFDGDVTITNGSAFVAASGVTLSNISGGIHGGRNVAGQDSISVALTATSAGKPNGTARIDGWVKNLLTTDPTFDLALGLNQFHTINRRSLADLYLSMASPRDSIRLRGSVAAPRLAGALIVDHTSIYLPDRDIARKQAVTFVVEDTAGIGTAVSRSAVVSRLMTNLEPSVTITLGNDVRLRSAEANVRLSGELHVATSSMRSTRTLASGELVPGLTLEGTLRTEGGTYNLDLGLVQREFQVLSGGTVTFTLAESWKNPTLDIKARHTIKQQNGDLGVIVNLQGPLIPYPSISFSATGVDYEIPQSDLVSYLLIGKPGFDFLQNQASAQVLASFLAPTLSAVAADQLRQKFGSFFNVLQLQLGGSSEAQGQNGFFTKQNLSQYFYGATLTAEQQFRNNLYLSVNTGFCHLNDQGGARLSNALNNVGAKVEYRFDPRLSMQLAYDPATEYRSCSGSQNLFGLTQSPPNFSFSLSHVWRF